MKSVCDEVRPAGKREREREKWSESVQQHPHLHCDCYESVCVYVIGGSADWLIM